MNSKELFRTTPFWIFWSRSSRLTLRESYLNNLRSCKFICKNVLCMNLELPFELVDSLCQSLAEDH